MQDRQTTSRGFTILSAAGIINKVLALIYIPIQTHIIGNFGNGIVSAGYGIYVFVFYLSNAGIPVAMSKLVSEEITLGNYRNAQKIFKIAGAILMVTGLVSSAIMALGAHIISGLISMPKAWLMLIALSPTLLFTSVSSMFRGYFQGRSNMIPTAVSQILEQALNSVLTVTFAALLIRYGIVQAAAGTTIGTSMGALGAASYLYSVYRRNKSKIRQEALENSKDTYILTSKNILRKMLVYCMPAILSVVAINLYNLMDISLGITRMMAGGFGEVKATELFGIYSNQYQRLLNIPLALTAALPTALIPAISMLVARKDSATLRKKIREGFRVIFVILIPSAAGLAVLAKPIITFIFFSTRYNQGSDMLMIGSCTLVIIAAINIESGILIGVGKPYIAPVNLAISLVLKVLLNFILISIPAINIKGAIFGTIAGYLLACILDYIMIMKSLDFSLGLKKLIMKPVVASLIMAGFVYGTYNFLFMVLSRFIHAFVILNDACILVTILAGAFVYMFLLLKFKALNSDDIVRLPAGNRINAILQRIYLMKA